MTELKQRAVTSTSTARAANHRSRRYKVTVAVQVYHRAPTSLNPPEITRGMVDPDGNNCTYEPSEGVAGGVPQRVSAVAHNKLAEKTGLGQTEPTPKKPGHQPTSSWLNGDRKHLWLKAIRSCGRYTGLQRDGAHRNLLAAYRRR